MRPVQVRECQTRCTPRGDGPSCPGIPDPCPGAWAGRPITGTAGGSGADRALEQFRPRSVPTMSRPCSGLVTEWWPHPPCAWRAADGPYGAGDGVPGAECAGAADHHRHRPLHQAAPAEPLRGETPGPVPGGDADPAVGRRLADGAEPGVAPGRSSRDPARLLLRPAPGRSRRHDFAGGDDPPSTRSRHRRVDRRRRNAATYPWRPDALPSATSTCPSRSATPAAAPTSRCFSCWSRTEGSATAPPSSCSGGCRQPAAGCRTAGPTGQPHRPSAARPRGAAFGRVRVRRCRASCRSRCRGLR
ncbi:hypothetical protein DER30_6103 [Streptomyces sp. HB202]|nr:hypothetical protein DER30_6103 [Streptomyces sp. HB202]